jgi:hypothetical protein
MMQKLENPQPDLFELDEPRAVLAPAQKIQLAAPIEALLLEIAAAPAGGEVGDAEITAERLSRGAFVYIRQSTVDQLMHNQESRRRQYGLAERARQLGWSSVEIIDDDLGRSGTGINRPGFERLLTGISARAALAPDLRSRRLGWLTTAATGTH